MPVLAVAAKHLMAEVPPSQPETAVVDPKEKLTGRSARQPLLPKVPRARPKAVTDRLVRHNGRIALSQRWLPAGHAPLRMGLWKERAPRRGAHKLESGKKSLPG